LDGVGHDAGNKWSVLVTIWALLCSVRNHPGNLAINSEIN